MIRGPISHQSVPGDIPRGGANQYTFARTVIVTPSLPIRDPFRQALPATFVPLLTRGQGGPPIGVRTVYRGLAPTRLQPVIVKRDPWE